MNFHKKTGSVFALSLVSVALLTACSSEEDRREANRDFNYTDAKLHATLITPSTLKAPAYSSEYKVATEQRNGPIAKDVDVRPPESPMTYVASSRVDNTSVNPKLWYSARSLNENIGDDLWRWLKTFMQLNHYPIEKIDETNKEILTGPISLVYEGEHPDDIPPAPAQKFHFKVSDSVQNHQSSVEASWVGVGEGDVPTIFKQRNYSAHLLNQFSAYTDTQAKGSSLVIDQTKQIQLVLGTDSAGSKAIMAENPYGQTWAWLLTAMPQAGLPVTYSSQSQGLIEFEYKSNDSVSMMDVLTFWKPAKPQEGLALTKGMYRLQLADKGSETSITLLDDANKPVLVSSVERLYQRLGGLTSIDVKANTVVAAQGDIKPADAHIVQKPIHLERKEGVWVADASAADVMSRTSKELESLGWKMKNSDSATGSITVNYAPEEGGLLDALALWKPIAPHYEGLANGEYTFKVTEVKADSSKVSLLDSFGKPVTGPVADAVLQALSNKLELSN